MNIRPYYDDFSEDSNYYRILFRPSFSVQARELTQLQTILSDQIGKVGNSLLDDGDVLSGGEMSYDSVANTVTVKNGIYYLNGMAINVDTTTIQNVGVNDLIGFVVVEEFVGAGSDDTLYDNAAGSPNYRGPGADRFKVSLTLSSRTEIIEDEIFIEIFRLIGGKVFQSSSTASTIITEDKYSDKVKKSDGDYVTDAFDIDIKDTGTSYSVKVSDGLAIVDGREISIEGSSNSVTVPKARDPLSVNKITANIETGQYSYIHKTAIAGLTFGQSMDLKDSGAIDTNGALLSVGTATPTHVAPHDSTYLKVYLEDVSYEPDKSSSDVRHLGNIPLYDGLGQNTFSFQGTQSKLFTLSAPSVTDMEDFVFDGVRKVQKQTDDPARFEVTAGFINVSTLTGNFVDLENTVLIARLADETAEKAYTIDDLYITVDGSKLKFTLKDDTKTFSADVTHTPSYSVVYSYSHSFSTGGTKTFKDDGVLLLNSLWDGSTELLTSIKVENGGNAVKDVISFTAHQYKSFVTPNTTDLNDPAWVDVTSQYMMEKNDTPSQLGDTTIRLRPTSLDPTGVVSIQYTYWQSGGTENVYHGGSYVGNFDKLMDFDSSLADVLDLRSDDKIFYNCRFKGKGVVNGKRTDSLVLRSDGSLNKVTGAKYVDRVDKNFVENGIKLYDLTLNPYDGIDFQRTHGVKNVNYIHNLGERISKLEEKIVFTPLETEALNTDVGTSVIEGVIVDGFRGIGKTTSNDVSIDYVENELRPNYAVVRGSVSHATDKVITLPTVGTGVSDIANLQTSGSILINETGASVCYVSLDPIAWYDDTQTPFISSDPDKRFDGADTTSVWNGWQHFWYGGLDDSVYTSSISVDNKGKRLLGNNLRNYVSGSITGTISPAPSGTWDLYMDGDLVVSGYTGGNINVALPSSTLSGKKLIEIKDGNTVLGSNYLYARGFGQVGQEKSLSGLVQEFDVVTDTFYTKVDLYVDTVDMNVPIFVQLKDMATGQVVPYSTTSVTLTSITDVGKQTFTFPEKVLLRRGKYGLVVATSSSTAKLTTGRYSGSSIGPLNGNGFSNLKFNLYRADFNTSGVSIPLAVSSLVNPIEKIFMNTDYSDQIRVYQPTHSYSVDETVELTGFVGREVQEVTVSAATAAEIDSDISAFDGNDPANALSIFKGLTAFQQLADVPADQIQASPSDATLLAANSASHNYGKIIDWNSSTHTLTFEMITGKFTVNHATEGTSLTISVYHPNYTNHYQPVSVSDTGTTSVGGILTEKLNTTFTVKSRQNDSFVLEAISGNGFTPQITSFYASDTIGVSNPHVRADMLYLNSTNYVPTGTSETWKLQVGSSTTELASNTNTYLQSSTEVENPSIDWEIGSTDSRVSPVLYTEASDLLIVSNLIDSMTPTFEDKNLNWTQISPKVAADFISIGVSGSGLLGKDDVDTPADKLTNVSVGDYLALETSTGHTTLLVVTGEQTTGHIVSGGKNISSATTNVLYKLVGYVPETHRTDGTSQSKYTTKLIEFNNSINGVRVDFDAICPTGNWIEVYWSDGDKAFTEIPINYPLSGTSSVYQPFSYESVFGHINSLEVKIVIKGDNTVDVPKIKNLKVIGYNDHDAVIPSTAIEVATVVVSNQGDTPDLTIGAIQTQSILDTDTITISSQVAGGTGTYSYTTSSQYSFVTHSVDASGVITLTGPGSGNAGSDTITLTATDQSTPVKQAQRSFAVSVADSTTSSLHIQTIPDQSMVDDGNTITIDISSLVTGGTTPYVYESISSMYGHVSVNFDTTNPHIIQLTSISVGYDYVTGVIKDSNNDTVGFSFTVQVTEAS